MPSSRVHQEAKSVCGELPLQRAMGKRTGPSEGLAMPASSCVHGAGVGSLNLSNRNERRTGMQDTTMTNGSSSPPPAVAMNGQSHGVSAATEFTPERAQELVAALEDPFDPSEIKWRVTNTCKVGGPKGPRDRGQMLAYADPRAYTDRLNDLFAPSGWTRDYNVQMVQNFERKERGATERTITAKIVVTSKVTIYGLGPHAGLGEEWAENDNAGTAAEAQAFKRACSCFGLGRYLYDLEGQWVDLDEKKRPLETPSLPDWARPKLQRRGGESGVNGKHEASGRPQTQTGGGAKSGRGGLYRDELLEHVKALCGTVGFSQIGRAHVEL